MKKYNVANYIRYKEDLKASMPDDKPYKEYTRNEMIVKFMPLVETMARKFSTSDQASGVLSINDFIQEGNYSLTRAVDKLDWETLEESEDIEKTLRIYEKICKKVIGGLDEKKYQSMIQGKMPSTVWTMKIEPTKKRT